MSANRERAAENDVLTKENRRLSTIVNEAERKANEVEAGRKENFRKATEIAARLKDIERKSTELELTRVESQRKVRLAKLETARLRSELEETRQKADEPAKQSPTLTAENSENDLTPIALPPDGREAFTPVLETNHSYKITVEGTCVLLEENFWGNKHPIGNADGFYLTSDQGAYTERHEWLCLDGRPLAQFLRDSSAIMSHEDRDAHRYTFCLKGLGQKVGISLQPHISSKDVNGSSRSKFMLRVEKCQEAVRFPRDVDPAPRKGRAQKKWELGAEVRRAREIEQDNIARKAKLENLKDRARWEGHYCDPEFQKDFAQHETKQILESLKDVWMREYAEFMRDTELKRMAEETAPEVIALFEARLKIVQLAERVSINPGRRRSKKAVERKAMLDKKGDLMDDDIAVTNLTARKMRKGYDDVDAMSLDQDDKNQLKEELKGKILDRKDGDGNENSTAL